MGILQSLPRIRIEGIEYLMVSRSDQGQTMAIQTAWRLLMDRTCQVYSGWIAEGVLLEQTPKEHFKSRVKLGLIRIDRPKWRMMGITEAFGEIPKTDYGWVRLITATGLSPTPQSPNRRIVLKLQLGTENDWDEIELERMHPDLTRLFPINEPEPDTGRIRVDLKEGRGTGSETRICLPILVQRHYLLMEPK